MAYTKQTWADLPSKTTPINAERLTHIEDGIFNAAATADNAASTAGTAAANVGIVSGKVETLTERVNGLDTAVSNKVDKVAGKGLSTNDYSNTDKGKVDALGTASTKNSTSTVTDSSDLVESGAVYTALQSKVDNTVIGTVEDGTNPTKAYAVGEHFIRNGKFCTVTVAVTTSSTWKLGGNYVEGTIADNVLKKVTFSGTTNASGNMALVSGERKNIISVIMDDSEQIALPYFSQYGNTNIHVLNSSMNVVTNISVSGTYYYI